MDQQAPDPPTSHDIAKHHAHPTPDEHKSRRQLLAELHAVRQQLAMLQDRPAPHDITPPVPGEGVHPATGDAATDETSSGIIALPAARRRVSRAHARTMPARPAAPDDAEEPAQQRPYAHLRRQLEFTRAITDSIGDGVIAVDHAGHVSFMNPAASALLGWSTGELLGKDLHARLHPDAAACTSAAPCCDCRLLCPVTSGQTITADRDTFARRDGGRLPVRWTCSPIHVDGQLTGAVLTFVDMTDRDRLERAVRASNERFRATFEQAAIGVGHVSLDGRWIQVNDTLCAILGYTRAELLSLTFMDITYVEDLDTDVQQVRRLLAGELPTYTIEKRYIRKDGSLVWVELTVSLVRNASGEPDYFISLITDIGGRKRLEEERSRALAREQAARIQAEMATRELGALQAVTDTALATLGQEDLLRDMLDRLSSALAVEMAGVLLPEDGGRTLVLRAAVGTEHWFTHGLRVPTGKGPLGRALLSGRPVVVEDLATAELAHPPLRVNVQSLLCAPLLVQGRALGEIAVASATRRHFAEKDIQLLQLVADRVALAIDRTQAFDAAERARLEAEAATAELRALQSITDTALAHLEPDASLDRLLVRVREVMRVDNATILVADADREVLKVRAVSGLEDKLPTEVEIPFGRGFSGRIAVRRQPLVLDDLTTFEVHAPVIREAMRSVLGVPLLAGDRLVGVLHIGTVEPRHFTAADVSLLQRAAERVALSIDRARAYEAMRRSRAEAEERAAQLEAIFEAQTDGVMLVGRNHELLQANAAYHRMFATRLRPDWAALSVDERSSLVDLRAADGSPLPLDQRPIQRLLRGETLVGGAELDTRIRRLDGAEMLVNIQGAPVYEPNGEIAGAVAVLRDVTEQRALERRTRDALAALLDMARTVVAGDDEPDQPTVPGAPEAPAALRRLGTLARTVLDCERIAAISINPADGACRVVLLMGLDAGEDARTRAEFADFNALRDLAPELRDALGRGELFTLRFADFPQYARFAFGTEEAYLVPMSVGERPLGMLVLATMQPRERTDEWYTLAVALGKLAALTLERDRLLRERTEAAAQVLALRETNRRMGAFLSLASHELKTPITSVKLAFQALHATFSKLEAPASASDVALPRDTLDRALHLMRSSQASVARLGTLVEDLLDDTHIEIGHLHLRRKPCDLANLAEEAVAEQIRLHPTRRIELRRPEGERFPIVADAHRITKVIANYLGNALKFSCEDQPVTVELAREGNDTVLTVRDHGHGIPPTERERIWERFYRASGAAHQSGSQVGLGVGLHYCRHVVGLHGGRVGVESEPGHGSAFWLTLPLADS